MASQRKCRARDRARQEPSAPQLSHLWSCRCGNGRGNRSSRNEMLQFEQYVQPLWPRTQRRGRRRRGRWVAGWCRCRGRNAESSDNLSGRTRQIQSMKPPLLLRHYLEAGWRDKGRHWDAGASCRLRRCSARVDNPPNCSKDRTCRLPPGHSSS